MNQHDRYTSAPVGSQPRVESAPGQPQLPRSAPQKRDYSRGLSNGGKYEGQDFISGLTNDLKRVGQTAAQAGAVGYAATGSATPGFGRTTLDDKITNESNRRARRNESVNGMLDRAIANGRRDRSGSEVDIHGGPDWEQPAPKELNAGPRVHSVGPQKELPPVGNSMEVKAHRALGAGPSPQFGQTMAGDLASGVQATGGKVVSSRANPLLSSDAGSRRKEPRNTRRAGGNIAGALSNRSYDGERNSLIDPSS